MSDKPPSEELAYSEDELDKMSNLVEAEDKTSGVLIERDIDVYIRHIDSLARSFPLTIKTMRDALEVSHREYVEFVTANCQTDELEDKQRVIVELKYVSEFNDILKKFDSNSISLKLVPRSLLVALVSQFDSFIGQLLRTLFYLKPEMLNGSEKALKFSELVEFVSIDAAREYIIEKEIETVLRKSHSDQFSWLESKFKVPLRKALPIWSDFIELTERRNLLVHANGVVSSQYVKVCEENGVELDDTVEVGTVLEVSSDYFLKAYKCVYEIGVKLAHVLWRKTQFKDIAKSDKHLNKLTYNLLCEEKNDLAVILLDFITETLKNHSDGEQLRIAVINKSQANKWIGNQKKAIEILENEDWSGWSNEFKLGEAVIRDDFDAAARIMLAIGSSGTPDKTDYKDWVLFKEFRKSIQFLNAYRDIFEEDFALATTKRDAADEDSVTEVEKV